MKIVRLEHVGIAVERLDKSNELFSKLFDRSPYKSEKVESESVETGFFRTGEAKIELLQATAPDSPIRKFIDKKGEGIHHLAFEVEDIEEAFKYCRKNGFRLLNERPKRGADDKMIFFLHPKSTNGVLIEFCQSIDRE